MALAYTSRWIPPTGANFYYDGLMTVSSSLITQLMILIWYSRILSFKFPIPPLTYLFNQIHSFGHSINIY